MRVFTGRKSGRSVDDASGAAEQKQASYKPFELGLYFHYWFLADLRFPVSEIPDNQSIGQQEAPDDAENAEGGWRVFRSLQKDFGLTDDELIAATTTSMNDLGKDQLVSRLRIWEAK
jgi:hypothetical protein